MSRPFEVGKLRLVTDLERLAHERGWPYGVGEPSGVQELSPSRGLPEDVLDIVRHGKDRVVAHHYASEGGGGIGKAGVERWHAELHAPARRRMPETFVCEIPDALLVGTLGIVVTPRWEVLSQTNLGAAPGSAIPWVLRDAREVPAQTVSGRCVSLLTFASKSYAHWLLDALPRLALVGPDLSEYVFILPADPPRFQLETLALLGVDEGQIRYQDAGVQCVERLLVVYAADRLTDPRAAHLRTLRDMFLKAAGEVDTGGEPERRVYVTRRAAARPVVNEQELEPLLTDLGFDIVASESLSFRDQVALFARAAVVLGPHGAGLHNHIFNRRNATVVETLNPRLWTPSVQRTASICGHRHAHTFVENAGNSLETRVDPNRLRRLLASALSS